MILNSLRLSNYKQYSQLELDFREGLVGIIGKNGAGKSTLFEAILFCLFGKEEGNKIHVRSAFADPKSVVELELTFSIGEVVYRVKREFRGKALTVGAELYKNDNLIAKGVSPVNEELVKILHMERDAFKRSVFSGQKELSELSETTGEARKKMVRRMLGLDMLDETQIRINYDLRDLSSQAIGQRQNLLSDEAIAALKESMEERRNLLESNQLQTKEAKTQLNSAQSQYKTEQEKFSHEEARFKQHHALLNDRTQLNERLTGLEQQKRSLESKLAELQALKTTLAEARLSWAQFEQEKKQLDWLETEHTRQINRQARLAKIEESKVQLLALEKKTIQIREDLNARDAVTQNLSATQQVIADLEAAMDTRRTELTGLNQQIGGIQAGIRERQEKLGNLRALGNAGNCPTCLQPLLAGYEHALSALETEINKLQQEQLQTLDDRKKVVTAEGLQLKAQQEEARSRLEKWLQEQTRLKELERQLLAETDQQKLLEARIKADETILREIGEVQFDEQSYQQLKNRLSAQETSYREYLSQTNYLDRELPATENNLRNNQTALQQTTSDMAAKQQMLDKLGFEEAAYNAARQALADFTERYQKQSEALRELEKIGHELQTEQEKAAEKLRINDSILAQISHKLEEVELLRKLAEMLGLFKTEILEKVSPGITREASELFTRITKGKYEGILVDENFDFAIADGGIFYPIDRFSGGEVDLANFCLRIAITKAIMDLSGSGQRMEFLAFDEIFGSQDEERRLEMMLALNYLQEQFRQIYIVSHIDSLKDYFPHLLEVQFAAEGSQALWR
ncbi:MAG TPA: SMC family ATPase [Saprospiraceae bacterium]|nr:SMC family ATPase [Saprospiraceae bacterium]